MNSKSKISSPIVKVDTRDLSRCVPRLVRASPNSEKAFKLVKSIHAHQMNWANSLMLFSVIGHQIKRGEPISPFYRDAYKSMIQHSPKAHETIHSLPMEYLSLVQLGKLLPNHWRNPVKNLIQNLCEQAKIRLIGKYNYS